MEKIELMAPAGDIEKLKIALLYGADIVYIGGKKYSLRANASNFTIEDIKSSCIFAHKLGKKVYVTEVVASNVQFLESKNSQSNNGNNNYNNANENPFDNYNTNSNQVPQMETVDVENDPFANFGKTVDLSDDDLPF